MANRPLEIVTGFQRHRPPPLILLLLHGGGQLHSLFLRRKELTKEEISAIFFKPILCGCLTFLAVMSIVLYIDKKLFCHVSFSVESISVSPSSSATWHVDFLAKDPRSWCPINYNGDDVQARLNATVLKTSRNRRCSRGGHTSFSVDLATEGNQRVFELDMKLSAKKKHPALGDEHGHFDYQVSESNYRLSED